jgi:endonuclease III
MKTKIITDYLNEILSDAKCELNYSKDYELLIATMLSAQTTDIRVNSVTPILFKKYNSISKLANANIEDIKSIIKPIGTYNKKAKNIIDIANSLLPYNHVPNDREFLEKLSGVGRKTTNVVLSNIYNEPLIAVDTHVARVSIRLGLANKDDSPLIIEQKLNDLFKKEELLKLHHQLVLFGRYYCKAIKPECTTCKLQSICNYYQQKKTIK